MKKKTKKVRRFYVDDEFVDELLTVIKNYAILRAEELTYAEVETLIDLLYYVSDHPNYVEMCMFIEEIDKYDSMNAKMFQQVLDRKFEL